MKWYGFLRNWWYWLFPSKKQQYLIIPIDDIPDHYRSRVMYIVGTQANPWLLTFLCPCGCNAKIQLNLLEEESPNWRFTIENKKINVYPSINRTKGCRSHFWVRFGQIVWHLENEFSDSSTIKPY